jgi:hypothetical protein
MTGNFRLDVVACASVRFLGGSMGSVVGENSCAQYYGSNIACRWCFAASGGARMRPCIEQKTSRRCRKPTPFISVMTDPTTREPRWRHQHWRAQARVVSTVRAKRCPKDSSAASSLEHGALMIVTGASCATASAPSAPMTGKNPPPHGSCPCREVSSSGWPTIAVASAHH